MARIRSIHPNTPTDPELASVPVEARLLFIYSWTMADDAGNLDANPLGLRMALFPGDDWATVARITEIVDMLVAGRFYTTYAVDGKKYLHVRNFARYQKLDHPTAPKVPLAPGQTYRYHVRKGNTFEPKTEKRPLPEQHTNNTRTAHERSGAVSEPFSQEGSGLGLEGDGKELELDGKEGRGPGRETDPAVVVGASRPPTPAGDVTPKASRKVTPISDTIALRKLKLGDLRKKVEEALREVCSERKDADDATSVLWDLVKGQVDVEDARGLLKYTFNFYDDNNSIVATLLSLVGIIDNGTPPPPSPGNGQGVGKGNGNLLDFVAVLSLLKKDALRYAVDMYNRGDFDRSAVDAHLKGAGFTATEQARAVELLGEGR